MTRRLAVTHRLGWSDLSFFLPSIGFTPFHIQALISRLYIKLPPALPLGVGQVTGQVSGMREGASARSLAQSVDIMQLWTGDMYSDGINSSADGPLQSATIYLSLAGKRSISWHQNHLL